MNFTIIGCGNAGLIHAAKLYENNVPVGILKSSTAVNNDFFNLISHTGGYKVKDETNNGNEFFTKPNFITKDVKRAIEFADVIMVMTTTSQHEIIAQMIAPYVKDGQIITLVPGYMGSLIFKKYIKRNVTYCEWETTAYNGRIIDNQYVRITFYNPRNAISVLPVSHTQEVVNIFSKVFKNTKYTRHHILESALHNPNMIVHPIGLILSASRIEFSNGDFYMYREAFTPSIVNVIKAFDVEKNKLLNQFGCDSLNYFEAAKWRNEEDLEKDAMEVFQSFALSSNKGPSLIKHRYLTEDVPMGLGLFISIGDICGVDTTIPKSLMGLGSALVGRDLSKESRTIQKLLDKPNVSKADIQEAIGLCE